MWCTFVEGWLPIVWGAESGLGPPMAIKKSPEIRTRRRFNVNSSQCQKNSACFVKKLLAANALVRSGEQAHRQLRAATEPTTLAELL